MWQCSDSGKVRRKGFDATEGGAVHSQRVVDCAARITDEAEIEGKSCAAKRILLRRRRGRLKDSEELRTGGGGQAAPVLPLALVALVVGTMVLRTALVFVLPRIIKSDESSYLYLGWNLLSGQGYLSCIYPETYYTPLYPIVSGTLYLLVRDFEWASNLAYVLFGGLLQLPLFFLARRIYGLHTAWVTAIWLGIFPVLAVSVLHWGTMTEPLYLFLIYCGLAAFLVGFEENVWGLCAAAGAFFGLAYLTRPEGVFYFGVFLVFGLVWLGWRQQLGLFKKCRLIACYALAFLLVAGPYIWYLHQHAGKWMLAGNVTLDWELGETDQDDPVARDRSVFGLGSGGREIVRYSPERFRESVWQKALGNPARFARRTKETVRDLPGVLFDWYAFWYGLLALIGLALFNRPWDCNRLAHEVFLASIVVPVLVFLPSRTELRSYAPIFPVLLMWAAHGAVEMGRWLHDTKRQWGPGTISDKTGVKLSWLPAVLVMIFFLATMAAVARFEQRWVFSGEKEAGLWLRANAPATARVMAWNSAAALYARRPCVLSPNTDWESFLRYARAHRADYLVITDREVTEVRPQMEFLRDTNALPPELQLVFNFEEPHQWTLVYRFTEASRLY